MNTGQPDPYSGFCAFSASNGFETAAVPDTLADWTVCFWVKYLGTSSDFRVVTIPTTAQDMAILVDPNQKLVFQAEAPYEVDDVSAVGDWNHLAITCTDGVIQVYLNGVACTTVPHTYTGTQVSEKVVFMSGGMRSFFDVCLFSQALSSEAIAWYYADKSNSNPGVNTLPPIT